MRSVLVVLAAIAATVVAGGSAAAQNMRKAPDASLASRLQLDAAASESRGGTKVYVVQMAADPAISYAGGVAGFAKTAPTPGAKYNSRSSQAQTYTAHLAVQQDQALAKVGASHRKIYSYRHALNGFAAHLTAEQAAMLRKDKSVKHVWEDSRFEVDTNNSPKFLGLLNASNGLRTKHGLRGKGVIIGVLDSGAVQEHPSFADNGLPPPTNWNGICQPGEGWDADDCSDKLIGARWFADGFLAAGPVEPGEFLSPRDSDGHGTHTASTAAGNEVTASLAGTPLAKISGMAPDAYLAIYKVCFEDLGGDQGAGCFFSDSAAGTDAAVADGVDVLSFSVGTSASFVDPQDIAFLFAVDAGVFVARSSGNEGPGPSSTAAGEPWAMSVGASTLKGTGFALAANVNSPAAVAGTYPALEGAITKPLAETGPITDDLVAANPIDACTPIAAIGGKIALIARGGCTFDIKLTNAVDAGAGAVLVYTSPATNPKTVMGGDLSFDIPGVMIDNEPGLAILAQLQGGTAVNVTLSAGTFVKEKLGPGNVMGSFSSRGPYLTETDWAIKPDVTAPGLQILAGNTPEPNDGSVGDFFQYLQGTSMSTPHVSGIAALLIEAHPDWTPAMVKSALMTTARQNVVKEDGVTKADPFDFGAGHINPNKARDPGLVYDAQLFDYLAASCGTVTPIVTPGSCDFLADSGFSLDPADLNLPSISVGAVIGEKRVRRSVTNVALSVANYKAQVKAPPGFKVKIKPNTLQLRRGETKSFEVIITNVSAPPGEWRFGALTWTDGKHAVRSPIAVNAQTLIAPEEITGTGADGATSFDVTFGYDGPYAAGAHGLVDPFVTQFTVTDDPANNFDFLDGPSEVLVYAFELPAGTTYAQWELFDQYNDNPAHDLDFYLFYCPNFACTQIDQSFNVTSNERVSVQFPVNDPAITDPYVAIVHGFQTAGGAPANGIAFDWTVVGPEGNMTVSGPASAVLGQTATVDVEWSGLFTGPGGKQSGAVSHSNGTGISGLTIVNIDNDAVSGYDDVCAAVPDLCPT